MIIWIGIHSKTKRCMHDEIKFGLSEKHTKFEKIFLMVLTNQLIYLVNVKTMRKIFSNYVCFLESPNFTLRFDHKDLNLSAGSPWITLIFGNQKYRVK